MMRRVCRHGLLAVVALAVGSTAMAARSAPQSAVHANWPCNDPPPPAPGPSWLWAGAKFDPSWRADPAIAALVTQTAQRRMTETDAVAQIAQFAAGRSDRASAMARTGSGLIDMIGAEYRLVLDGIGRFNDRQAALAKRMQAAYAKLDSMPDDSTPAPNAELAALHHFRRECVDEPRGRHHVELVRAERGASTFARPAVSLPYSRASAGMIAISARIPTPRPAST